MKIKSAAWALTIVLLVCSGHAIAQQASIKGIVNDHIGNPLKLATVSLLHAKDSSLIKAGLTDDNGQFEISVNASGNFFVSCSITGFETWYSSVFELTAGLTLDLKPVNLKLAPAVLSQVTVSAKKPLIDVKPGKTVFNVQNSINATGSNGLELLQKSPGVSIDNNDNISMKGKTGTRIYVDGRMLHLGNEDLAAYLRSINSNDIEAIELISNPGVRYDASGNAGIINIRLRKNSSLGTNGSITAGWIQGTTPKGNGSASINYRNKKINVFSNASAGIGRYKTDIIAPRIQKDTLYDQRLLQLSDSKSYNLTAGADFFINKKQTIGILNTTNYNTDDWISYGNTPIFYAPAGQYIKNLQALNEIPRKRTSINTNLNYRYADMAGKEINIDLDHGSYRARANSYQPNYYIDKTGSLISRVITYNNTPTNIDIYTGKLDINIPAWKGQLGFGAKVSYVETNNILDFFNEQNGTKVFAQNRSYNFTYKENVNAVYITFLRQYNKWSFQAGLRSEQTNSEGVLIRADGIIQADNNVDKSYIDFFPNATVSFKPSEQHRFNLSYGRRIDRPNYQNLNPFELKLDELSYVKGNAFLRPQYTHNIELTYTWKSKINTAIGYSHVKDLATQTVDTLNNYTYAYAKNIATQQIASFSVSSPLSFTKWWNGFVNVWANYQVFKGKVNEISLDADLAAFGAFTQHSFVLGKDYSAELSGWFNGPSALGPTLKAKSIGAVDMGFQKLLFGKQVALKITATDIFRTAIPFRAKTDFGGVFLQFWVRRESQTVRLHLSYRFGNNKVKAARQRQSGLENEIKRIKEN